MDPLTLDQLTHWNREGLFPGPEETEEQFKQRAIYCLGLNGGDACLQEASALTLPLYDIAPNWVPVYYSREKLAPWHGGCAWIYQLDDTSPTAALLQLRPRAWLYEKKELVAHELCHVGRALFEEPQFEELLAYRTSRGLRRWFGPILISGRESQLFAFSLVLVLLADLFALFVDPTSWVFAWNLHGLPVGLMILGLTRLWVRQRQYRRCLNQLRPLVQEKAEAVAYRLTDAEIRHFHPDLIQTDSFRWRCLRRLYFVSFE